MAWPINARFRSFVDGTTNITADFLHAVQDALYPIIGGSKTLKSVQADGTGNQAATAAAGDVTASGALNGASANVTGVTKSARYQSGGTSVTTSDFSIGAGWGSTATKSVSTGSKDTAGVMSVTASGVGIAANPRIIFTFKDGTFPANGAVILVQHVDNDESANGGPLYHVVVKNSLTAPQWFMVGTPVTGHVYTFAWHVISL